MDKYSLTERLKELWHPAADDLIQYVDGQISARKATKIRSHLESCWPCRAKAEKVQKAICQIVDHLDGALSPNVGLPPDGWRTFASNLGRLATQDRKGARFRFRRGPNRISIAYHHRVFRFAAVGLILLVSVFVLDRSVRVSSVSADQLLQLASKAETQRILEVPHAIVYQKLHVRRKTALAPDQALTWEIWNDTAGSRTRQFVQDVAGRKLVASESVALPPLLEELKATLENNQMDWNQPLSAKSFNVWRRSLKLKNEKVSKVIEKPGVEALLLTTKGQGPVKMDGIREAELRVRTSDWHPFEQRLTVQGVNEVREYEITETASGVVGLLDAPVFSDIVAPPPPTTRPSTVNPSLRTGRVSEAETVQAEIQALYALHRARACLGDQIEVVREPAQEVEVRGLAENAERREELLMVLRDLRHVRTNIQTFEEALASKTSEASLLSRSDQEDSNPAAIKSVPARSPIQDELENYFAQQMVASSSSAEANHLSSASANITLLSNEAISFSQSALAEAWALRRLTEWRQRNHTYDLDPHSRWLLKVMLQDHLIAIRTATNGARGLLLPILISLTETSNFSLNENDESAPVELPSDEPPWTTACFKLFESVEELNNLSQYLFAGTNGRSAEPKKAIEQLLHGLVSIQNRFEQIETGLTRTFRDETNVLSSKHQ